MPPDALTRPAVPGTITILIADDHALMREGLAALLAAHADLQVIAQAANGREALRIACEKKPMVAVLDLTMPELNGIDTLHALATRAPQVAALMLSMHGGAQHVQQALAAGARGYLLKQSASTEVVAAVRAVAAGRRYFSREIDAVVAGLDTAKNRSSPLDSLSARERQVMQLVAEGQASATIAATLNLSPKSVDTYRSRVMEKLGVADVTGLIKLAVVHGLTPLE